MARHTLVFPEPVIYRCETTVRITDLSSANHLGFDNLVALVNDASARLFKEFGMDRTADENESMIFTDLSVSYRSEAFFGEELAIDVSVGEIREKGIELYFRVQKKGSGQVVALALIAVLFFDYRVRKATRVPEKILARLSPSK